MSLVLSRKNLTPTRTPVMTMAVTTAHVTPMITCFLVKRDFLPASKFPSAFVCSYKNTKHSPIIAETIGYQGKGMLTRY